MNPLEPLLDFLERLPAMDLPMGKRSIGSGMDDDGRWWCKFVLDTTNPLAWRVVQELGHVLNLVSAESRLPTTFMPVSPPPYLNGGVSYLSWVIECHDPEFTPANCVEWLEERLPKPIENEASWDIDDEE